MGYIFTLWETELFIGTQNLDSLSGLRVDVYLFKAATHKMQIQTLYLDAGVAGPPLLLYVRSVVLLCDCDSLYGKYFFVKH